MHSTACMCVTRYGIHLCERCASVVTSPFCNTLRSDIYHRQGAWPAPYICRRRRASCGLRTVAMSLNAISCRVNASATSDEMPLSVTRRPSNLSACATVLSTLEAPEPQDASARLCSPDHDNVVAQRHPSRCRQRLQATAPGVGLHQCYDRRRAPASATPARD